MTPDLSMVHHYTQAVQQYSLVQGVIMLGPKSENLQNCTCIYIPCLPPGQMIGVVTKSPKALARPWE